VGQSGREGNGPAMLLGTHEHTIDDKNRLTLPARFRHVFGDGIVVTRGMDGCLYAYTRVDWDRLVQDNLATLNPLSQEGRRMQRFFFSAAAEAEPDKQGRVSLPAALLEHAKLGRDVVVAGVHDHLEIWDRDAWRRELAEVEGSAEDVAERLAAKRD
jgi:MraZ protein